MPDYYPIPKMDWCGWEDGGTHRAVTGSLHHLHTSPSDRDGNYAMNYPAERFDLTSFALHLKNGIK